jgi:hypothetical protein
MTAPKIQKNPVLDNIVQNAKAAAEQIETPAQPSLQDYKHLQIDENSDVPPLVPVIKIGGEIVSTFGGITILAGQSKSGKSAYLQPIIAGTLTDNVKDPVDGIEVVPSDGKAVIHIDTEQAKHKHKSNICGILKRAGLAKSPGYFQSYNFLPLERSTERQNAFREICELASKEYGGIHMIVIDGIADLIDDVLDAKESTEIVNTLLTIATTYNCVVVTIIHLNPSPNGQGTKERGHLGSQLERKVESSFRVVSKNDVSTLEPSKLRNGAASNIPHIQISYDPSKFYHVFVGHKEKDKSKTMNTEKYEVWAKQALPNRLPIKYSDLVKKLEVITGNGTDSAKKYVKTMTELDIIKRNHDKTYSINI